ncbi:P. aerophilum family 66 protein, interruption-N [Pyrobaculum aerophilum str. IM2]|uniref:P. aerophilum family 66 protein, interruption-N n=1 Tax=Pyrobaculum aerophilum (strain ATCC 51768 / DSM 7523 / JCM 9630 / CIP 104966 / NBRC 100827 / IM2) TaxID=178306 RepID=Q8ZUL4_PYRAE|nr:P. aerophilum family 66 protein, interruption-N [Pyrobaculum aerophilum str. IM2]
MSNWALAVISLVALIYATQIEVYVDNGPDVDGLHIYVWVGQRWEPVEVVYVPQSVETYIVATGEWTTMPYYNASRYILRLPREALFPRGRGELPRGFERWTLEVDNGTRRVVVDITRAAYEAFRRYLKCTGTEAELVEPPPPPGRPVEERYCKQYGLYCGEMCNYVKIYGVSRREK